MKNTNYYVARVSLKILYYHNQNSCSPSHYVTVGKLFKLLSLNLLIKDVQNNLGSAKEKIPDYLSKISKDNNIELNFFFYSIHMCTYKLDVLECTTFWGEKG